MAGPTSGGGSGGSGGGSSPTPDPKTAKELSDALKASQSAAAAVTKSFDDQLKIILQMRDAMSQIAGQLEKIDQTKSSGPLSSDNLNRVSKSLKSTGDQSKKTTTLLQKMANFVKTPFARALLVAQGAVTGFIQGLKNLAAITKSVTGFFGSVISGAFNVAKAVISIPFKLLGGLFDMAQKGGGGNELAAAYEEVRDQFGSLKSEASLTVIGIARDAMKFNEAGLTGYRVYGNLAQAMQEVNKTAAAMGPLFQTFQKEMQENGIHVDVMRRGLGITDEQMQSLAQTALRTGKKISDVEINMTKQAYGMAKAFGLNAKVLTRDMAKAMQDVAHFGHLSTKELSIAAAYANKLGVSVDKLTGIMDATSTFDQAADSMSKLNQTFGTNIDATKMMMAQNPAEKVELLRKEFARTGKDMSKLTYQERMLIKQSSGLDDAMMDAAFSSKNAGVSLDKISKQGDKNEAKTMNQAEAMHELADAVKRLTPSGDAGSGGFLKHILDGFSKGIQSTPEFIKIMRNINIVMREATMFGVKLGRTFVNLFPGVKSILGGLGDAFNPARYRKMFNDVLKTFDIFKSGGVDSMDKFMTRLKEIFFNFFDKENPAGKKVLEGFKAFGQAAAKVFGSISKWVIDKVSGIIDDIAAWLRQPKMPDIGGVTSGLGGALLGPFDGALKSLSEKLWPSIKNLFSVIWDKMKQAIKEMSPQAKLAIGGTLGAIVLGPAIGGALTGLVSGGFFKKAATSIGGAAAAASRDASEAAQQSAAVDPTKSPAAAVAASIPSQQTIDDLERASHSRINWEGAKKFLVGIGGLFAVGLASFAVGAAVASKMSLETVGKAALVFATISTFMFPMAKTVMVLEQFKNTDWKAMGVALEGIGGMMLIGVTGFALGALAVKAMSLSAKDIGLTELFMLAMIPPLAAAGALVAEAKLVGGLVNAGKKEIITGMVAMGVVLAAMVVAAGVVGGLANLVGATEMTAGAAMLEVMSNTFMKTGVVIAEATLIGAAIISSAGVGAAIALAGFGAMTAAVVAMAGTASTIIGELGKIKGDPGAFKTKAEGFAAILNVVSEMMGRVSGILKSMDFGFFESEESKIQKMGAVSHMIKQLLNGDDGKGGINGVVQKIVDGIKTMTPAKVESTKAFASVLSAVSSMMSAASKGVGEMTSKAKGWFTFASDDIEMIKTSMKNGGSYTSTVMKSSGELVGEIIKSIQGIPPAGNFEKVGPVIGSVLQAVSGLISAVSPDISKFQKTMDASGNYSFLGYGVGGGAKSAEVDTAGITAMASYLSTLMEKLKTVIPDLVKGIMSGVTDNILKLDKNRLDALPAVGELFKTIASIVTAIASATKSGPPIDPAALKDSKATVINITNQIPDIAKIMEDIGKSAPGLLKNLVDIVKSVPADAGFKDKVKVVSELFGIVNSIIGGVSKAVDPGVVTQVPGAGTVNSILIALHDVEVLLWGFRYNWTDGGKESVKLIIEHLSALTSLVKDPKFGEKSKVIVDVFESINKIASAVNIQPPETKAGAVNDLLGGLKRTEGLLNKLATDTVVKQILGDVAKLDGIIAGKVQTVQRAIKNLEDFTKSLSDVSSIVTSLPTSNIGAVEASWDNMRTVIDAVEKKASPMIKSLDELMNSLGEIGDNAKKASKLALHMGNFNNVSSAIAKSMVNLPESIEKITDAMVEIPNEAMRTAILEFSDTVKAIQQMDDLMTRLPKVNLATKVGAMAGKLGLGSSGVYTVKSKDVVINVNFEITMDAGAVEKALITRTSSTIRDRINFLIENGSADVKAKAGAPIKYSGNQGTNVATTNP